MRISLRSLRLSAVCVQRRRQFTEQKVTQMTQKRRDRRDPLSFILHPLDMSRRIRTTCDKFTAMQKRIVPLTILLAVLATACSTSLFKVKPVTELPTFPESSRTADAGGVTVRIAPLLSDEETQDLFEANLPMAGVLAVRTELTHQSGVPVELKKARFRLQDGGGRTWKLLNPKQAVS